MTNDNDEEPYGGLWLDSYEELARLYDLTVIGVGNVGRLTGGPWRGRKCIGCSLAVGPGGVVLRGGRAAPPPRRGRRGGRAAAGDREGDGDRHGPGGAVLPGTMRDGAGTGSRMTAATGQ